MIRTVNVPVTYTLDESAPLVQVFLDLPADEQEYVLSQVFIQACRSVNLSDQINEGGVWAIASV